MWARIRPIVVKEFIELKRDKWARFRLIVPTLVQMMLFGYAATYEVYHVSTVVLDLDHFQESRDLISRFTFSDRFNVKNVQSQQQVTAAINNSDAAVALVIHAQFAELLRKGQAAPLQVIVDGTNSNTALIALGYVNTIAHQFAQDYVTDLAQRTLGVKGASQEVQVTLDQRPWFNKDLNGRWFFVPGLIGTLTLVIVVNLTAFAIVREREVGTLEQIMVSPIRPAELILGKTVPFFIIGLGEVSLVVAVAILWFQVPFVRESFGANLRIIPVPVVDTFAWPADIDLMHNPATGLLHKFFGAQSAFHTVRFRLSDLEHAAGITMGDLSQSAAVLPYRHSGHVSQRGRRERAVAGARGDGGDHLGFAHNEHPAVP